MQIRPLCPGDIPAFWTFLNRLDDETDTMMYEPGERRQTTSEAALAEELETCVLSGDDLLLLAVGEAEEGSGEIIGYLRAERGPFRRVRHTAYLTAGILAAGRGQGIGTALFARLDDWARENGVHRLELTVECRNAVALRLYQRAGFVIEGLRRDSMRVDGAWVDEYLMSKLI
ncbi:MAG: GNAT family N-acetyltransferase [Clostridia bacterium]|nr:GNAT family N-acetyltransferase [Clostridia bacterium]